MRPDMPVKPVARPAMGKMSFRKKADLISTFTMSSTLPKCIALIVKRIHFGDLLDCPLFATKPPFHPRSSRCSFSECLYTKHFPKHALLDLLRSLMPRGKVHRFRGKARHFPRKKGLCTHGRCWKYEEKCYKKDCNENLK
mgnify:CR=1 FL=1